MKIYFMAYGYFGSAFIFNVLPHLWVMYTPDGNRQLTVGLGIFFWGIEVCFDFGM